VTTTAWVVAEAPIDALSYHQLFQYRRCRYVATAGALSPAQLVLIRDEIAGLPARSRVVIASDNDAGGDRFAEKIEEIVGGVSLRRHLPPEGKDWNEYLQAVERHRPRGPELAR
jgi:DNA primase